MNLLLQIEQSNSLQLNIHVDKMKIKEQLNLKNLRLALLRFECQMEILKYEDFQSLHEV